MMRLIRQLIYYLLVTITVYLASILTVNSATLQEQEDVLLEGRMLCTIFGVRCTTVIDPSTRLFANTDGTNKITISSELGNVLTKDELRAVVYHEVGHASLKHIKKLWFFLTTQRFDEQELKALRHKHELEADRFASYVLLVTNQPNELVSALKKIVAPEYLDKETRTHPVTTERIRRIEAIKGF